MKKSKPNLDFYFKGPTRNLRSFLQRNVQGSTADYRPPFWRGQSREEVAAKLLAILENSNIEAEYPTLYGMEIDNMNKIGPMSIMKPLHERIHDVESYYEVPQGNTFSQEAFKRTLETMKPMHGIRLKSRESTVEDMKLSTNSGAPYFTKKSLVVEETINETWDESSAIAILGWRGQLGGPEIEDVKQRVVWMYPFLLNIEELRFYQPFIKAAQRSKVIPPWISNEAVEESMTKLFDTKDSEDLVVATDFTAFDQHINPQMQEFSRSVYEALATPSKDMSIWLEEIYPVKYRIPLILSEDIMYSGAHGMGSGSGGTNGDETVDHIGMQHSAAIDASSHRNPYSMAIGDDGVVSYPGLDLEQLVSVYRSFGQTMNLDKQFSSTFETKFLQRYYNENYRSQEGRMLGIYPLMRALGRLLAQERFYDPKKWNAQLVTLRAWSIIENTNNHPLFEEFVDFVMQGDKFRLGLDIPGFLENVIEIAQEAVDELPGFLGFTAELRKEGTQGIRSWRIFKYISSKKKQFVNTINLSEITFKD